MRKRLTEEEWEERDRAFTVEKTCCVCGEKLGRLELPFTPGDAGICNPCARSNPYQIPTNIDLRP